MTTGATFIESKKKGNENRLREFAWKEDDPRARIILEGSFGLHAKTRLLGSTFHLVYMQDLCSAR